MKYDRATLEKLRAENPALYSGRSWADQERALQSLDDVSTEALACELSSRGYLVRLER